MDKNNYSVKEFSQQASGEWDSILYSYLDYNIYQSYGWGEFKKTQGWNVLRLVCYKDDKDAALSQCLYRYYRLFNIYVLWIPGGPVFLKEGSNIELDSLCYLINAILDKFKKYKYYLRIYPMQRRDSRINSAISAIGFQRPLQRITKGLTYHIHTLLPEARVSEGLSSNWRHNLKRASRGGLTLACFDSEQDLAKFYGIYSEMARKKKFKAYYSSSDLSLIRNNLLPKSALYLFTAASGGTIVSGRIIYIIGRRAFDFIAAVTDEGRKKYASYLLIWEIINWCRQKNIEYFDLSGVDPLDHKDIFNFKSGLGGEFIEYTGEWELSNRRFLKTLANLYIGKFIKD